MQLTMTRRLAIVAIAAVVGTAALAGCSGAKRNAPSGGQPSATGSSHEARAGAIAPPSAGAYLGVFRPPGPFNRVALSSYAKVSAKKPAIVMWYQQWGTHGSYQFDPAMVVDVYKRGAVPMISWEPWDPGSKPHNIKNPADAPDWNLASIASGKHDAYLRSWAQGIKHLGGPVMLRPMHEMNGNWYPWSGTANGNTPQQYIAAWRHMHDIFTQEGATNVTWVWSVNWVEKPNTPQNAASVYYPGDAYVDWVSSSGFNWAQSIPGVAWMTFDDIFTHQLTYLKTLGKPIVIGETASVEQGGDKAAWISQTYTALAAEHPEIKAIVYYDAYEKGVRHGVQDWRIQSSKKSTQAYATAVSADYLVGGPVPELAAWEKGLSAADRRRIANYPHLYLH